VAIPTTPKEAGNPVKLFDIPNLVGQQNGRFYDVARDGQKFIVYDQKSNTNNLPDGQDLAATFGCMASVGTQGCGLEQPVMCTPECSLSGGTARSSTRAGRD